MGALPVSRGRFPLGILVYILWLQMYSTSSRLVLAPTFVVIPVPSFPHTEQLLLIVMHVFHLMIPRLQLLLVLFQLFLDRLNDLAHPRS